MAIEGLQRKRRGFTVACRILCSALVAAPLLYAGFVVDGDAYHFLILVLLAPVAGLVLAANSLYTIIRYRKLESPWIGLVFIPVAAVGVLTAWHFLPQFRM